MKRANEGYGDAGRRPPKIGRSGKFGPCAFKVLCPEQLVAKMMGGQGAAVHQIEDRTSSHLQFSPRGEYYPDTRLRILTVHAPEPRLVLDALAALLDQVIVRADEERTSVKGRSVGDFIDGAGKIIFRCALSKAAAGAIIGSKGERVRALRDSTGALVDIAREVVDNHQLVTLGGSREQLLSVLDELNGTVQADSDTPWFAEWAELRGISASAGEGAGPRRAQRSSGPARSSQRSEEHRDCTLFVGHLAQATDAERLRSHFSQFGRVIDSDVRTDPSTGRSKGFGFVTFSEPAMAEAALAAYPEHEIDDRRVDVKRYGEPGGDGLPVRGDHPGPPAPRRDEEGPRGGAFRDEPRDGPRGGAYCDEARDGPRGGYRDEPWERNGSHREQRPTDDSIEWFADLASTVPTDYLALDYCIACSLPSAKCGALIGRRGEHVAEVQRLTGATVSVGKKEPHEPADAHRTVTITGQLLSVYAAHLLLMRHYNDEEAQFRASQEGGSNWPRGPGGGGRGGGGPPSGGASELEALQRQLTELSEELNRVRSGGGGGGGGRRRSPQARPTRAW
mmetsp:Transcript_57736/g.159663  ORF Transcript_57736/g.159663 Transcript_57736/m.159663 type:complete len:563 (+) Transcript_57736:48-1736(+)